MDSQMTDSRVLRMLILEPKETPRAEYKTWLELGSNSEHDGLLAKAVIALANEGGGYLVIGFGEQDSKLVPGTPPSDCVVYDQDTINSIVKKFAEPSFHCSLEFANHPDTAIAYPVVAVPGGHSVPIMSKKGTAKSISAHTCYVRRTGPESAPPTTYHDWSRLLDRCIRNRQVDMLDSIRAIVQGRVDPGVATPTDELASQDTFAAISKDRWAETVKALPSDDPARFCYGHYEVDFGFQPGELLRLPALVDNMRAASNLKYTGWTPFWIAERAELAPKAIDGVAECWLGKADDSRLPIDAAHADFWRVSPEIRAFLMRGYAEDGIQSHAPATVLDVTLPIWRIGEILLYADRLARLTNSTGNMLFRVRWSGLSGRKLAFLQSWSRSTGGDHTAVQDAVKSSAVIPLDHIEDNLTEILHPLLQPLYEAFNFFELPTNLVSEELKSMRRKS